MSDLMCYRGEAFSQTLDLDTSATDGDYSLAGVTVRLRVSELGSATSVLAKDLTVDNATTGTLDITLTPAETAALTSDVYAWQLVDTAGPTVLAAGSLVVVPLITESA